MTKTNRNDTIFIKAYPWQCRRGPGRGVYFHPIRIKKRRGKDNETACCIKIRITLVNGKFVLHPPENPQKDEPWLTELVAMVMEMYNAMEVDRGKCEEEKRCDFLNSRKGGRK